MVDGGGGGGEGGARCRPGTQPSPGQTALAWAHLLHLAVSQLGVAGQPLAQLIQRDVAVAWTNKRGGGKGWE